MGCSAKCYLTSWCAQNHAAFSVEIDQQTQKTKLTGYILKIYNMW